MKIKHRLFMTLALATGYAAAAGCGDDASVTDTSADAGNDAPTVGDSSFDAHDARDGRSPEFTGSACTTASECYTELDGSTLKGEAVCIDKTTDGYCTHKCQTDEDCCAVPGECRSGLKQVCSSFENSPDKYCFLSCEDDDISAGNDAGFTDAGVTDGGGFDGTEYCHQNVSDEFTCRSSGGGGENRKICFPEGPPNDAGADADADAN